MKTEAQRIAIAEAWGAFPGSINKDSWLGYFPVEHSETLYSLGYLTHELMESDEKENYILAKCPAFPTDLNAMHEAEKMLTREQRAEFIGRLFSILTGTHWEVTSYHLAHGEFCLTAQMVHEIASATAAQRAEAFLRTLNLWTETP